MKIEITGDVVTIDGVDYHRTPDYKDIKNSFFRVMRNEFHSDRTNELFNMFMEYIIEG